MGQLYSSDSQGINPQYIWFGQVVDESTWVDNNAKEEGKDSHIPRTRDDFQGFGYRYKVRIFGRDLSDKEEGTKDEQLYMATCTLPVTAGSGIGGAIQTPQLTQGSYVYGFWQDGIQGTEPIISQVLPNNAQTRLFGGDPSEGFVPRSGYKGLKGDKPVSTHNILKEGGDDHVINESVNGPQVLTVRDTDIPDDASPANWVPSTFNCDGPSGAATNVSIVLKRVFYFINKIKSLASSWSGAMSDLQNGLNSIIQDGAIIVTNLIKDILDRLRGVIIKEADKKVKTIVGSLPPNLRPIANEAQEGATTAIDCLVNGLIDALFDFIFKALSQVADKIVNPVSCAIENFVGSLLSKILGVINGSIGSIFDGLASSLNSIASGNISIGGFSLNDALNIINGLLDLLSCAEDKDCSAGTEWSIFYGAESITESIQSDLSKVVSDIRAVGTSGGGSSCDTSPTLCGPPSITIRGGGGRGAKANPIISAAGQILSVDLISKGVGYKSPPNIYLNDPCGNGRGAKLVGILGLNNSIPIGNLNGNRRTTSSSVNDNGISSSSNVNGQTRPVGTNVTTDVGFPVVCKKKYVVSTEFGDPTKFRSYISVLDNNISRNVEFLYSTVLDPITNENVRLQVFAGGIGGIQVKCGAIGGSQVVDSVGNPIVVNGTSEPVVAGGIGGSEVTTTDGRKIYAGGTGGNPLVDTNFLPSENPSAGLINTDDTLIPNVDRSIVLDGSFVGRGTYNDGRFDGFGVFTGILPNKKEIKIDGLFSGFDRALSGLGEGEFTGTGSLSAGRISGSGFFKPDPTKRSDPNETVDSNGVIRGELQDGTQYIANPDGTGSVTFPGKSPTSVLYAKLNSSNGLPVIACNETLQNVTVGGDGGSLLRVKINEVNNFDNLEKLSANGIPISSKEDSNGIPIVVGLRVNDERTQITCDNIPVKSNGNTLYAIGNISKNTEDISSPGDFAGPDGAPLDSIIVVNGGVGFLSAPDGSTGGAGSGFSDPDSTIKFNETTGYSVYPPDTDIPVVTGDLIFLPPGTESNVYDNDGELIQTLIGEGQTVGLKIIGDGTITTPKYDGEDLKGDFPSSGGSYPVVLQLKDILIINPGGNYKKTDEIVISPNNGAAATPIYDKFGSLVSLKIESLGIGFTEAPDIFISSTSGINAALIPIFEVLRVGDLGESEDTLPENVELIQVVDCVGKIT